MNDEPVDRRRIVFGPSHADKRRLAHEFRRELTPSESCLWQRLRRSGVAGLHFRRQQVVDGFVVDFYCHAAGLVVEVDGPIHEQQLEADRERQAALERRGLLVLRFTNQEVEDVLDAVVERIAAVGAARREWIGGGGGGRGGPPPPPGGAGGA